MGTSLGLDETGNDWVIKLGLRESFSRSRVWAGTSWLSNALMIGARWIGGDHEAVLRMPSLAAALATLVALYYLGKRLAGPLAAAYACLVFVCLRDVVYIASAMRPYALAVFFVTATTLSLVKWLDEGRPRDGVVYVLLAAATVYAHVLYGATLLVHAAFFALRRRENPDLPVRLPLMLVAWAVVGALAVPPLLNLRTLLLRPVSSLYLGSPGVSDLLVSLAPPLLVGSVVLALTISSLGGYRPLAGFQLQRINAALLATWIMLPPGVLFLTSVIFIPGLFAERYYLASAPAIALGAGAFIAGFPTERVRRTIAGSIAICAVLVYGVQERFSRGLHDWRAASAAISAQVKDSSTPVLVISGFTESRNLEVLHDPVYAEVLYAPIVRYPIPGEVVRLPIAADTAVYSYLEDVVSRQVAGHRRFLLMGINSFSTREYVSWLSGRLRPTGFTSRLLGEYGGIQVTAFERPER
jgi:hypothetical protein